MVIFATGNRQWEAALPTVVDELARSKERLSAWGQLMQGVNDSTGLTDPPAAAHRELCRSMGLSVEVFNRWVDLPHPDSTRRKGQRWSVANESLRCFIRGVEHAWMCHLMLLIKTQPFQSVEVRPKLGTGVEAIGHAEQSIQCLTGVIPTPMETAIAMEMFRCRTVLEADIAIWSPIVEPLVPVFSGIKALDQT